MAAWFKSGLQTQVLEVDLPHVSQTLFLKEALHCSALETKTQYIYCFSADVMYTIHAEFNDITRLVQLDFAISGWKSTYYTNMNTSILMLLQTN